MKEDRSLNISYITSYGKYHCKSNLLLPYDLYIVLSFDNHTNFDSFFSLFSQNRL